MPASPESLWVELVGSIIVARIRGIPSEALIRECQARVISLLNDTGCKKVMYDALELDNPTVEIALAQQPLTAVLKEASMRIAIVVSSTKTAYLARLAFGEGNHRVFYNDITSASRWLEDAPG